MSVPASSFKLMKHQTAGVKFLKKHSHAAIFDEPGLGKSAQALLAAEGETLIVAPAMVLTGGVWDDEVDRWRPDLEAMSVPYSRLSKRITTEKGGSAPTGKLRADIKAVNWGTVILDEAHYAKGRTSNWTRALKELKADRWILLTGTPIPNWAHEAFTLLQMIWPEEAKPGGRFGSYWRWVEEWFTLEKRYGKGGKIVSDHVIGDLKPDRTWEEFMKQNWGDRMVRRLRENCLDLPPMTEQTYTVDMVPEQRKAYRELKKDFVTWLDNGAEIAAWNNASQLVKLCKCATGLELFNEDEEGLPVFGSGKLDALRTLLRDRDQPTLVVAHFQDSVIACADACAEATGRYAEIIHGGIDQKSRKQRLQSFRDRAADGLNPVLCASLGTISEGLTLTEADTVIRVERSFRPSLNEQVKRRIHRIGQTKPVTVIDLVSRDTTDERVLDLLEEKSDQQMKALGDADLRALVG